MILNMQLLRTGEYGVYKVVQAFLHPSHDMPVRKFGIHRQDAEFVRGSGLRSFAPRAFDRDLRGWHRNLLSQGGLLQ